MLSKRSETPPCFALHCKLVSNQIVTQLSEIETDNANYQHSINSYIFLFAFLPIALIDFWLSSRVSLSLAGLRLVLTPFIFYGHWRLDFQPFLLISSNFNYIIGTLLVRTVVSSGLQSAFLTFGITADIEAPLYFKSTLDLADFLSHQAVSRRQVSESVLPLGNSFFTFTEIGYLVDVKQGMAKRRDPLSYVLFATCKASKVLAVYGAALEAFAFLRAASNESALQLLAGMVGLHGTGTALPRAILPQVAALFAIVWCAPNTQQIMTKYEPALGRAIVDLYPRLIWNPVSQWAVVAGAVAALGVPALGGTTDFLYFQF